MIQDCWGLGNDIHALYLLGGKEKPSAKVWAVQVSKQNWLVGSKTMIFSPLFYIRRGEE